MVVGEIVGLSRPFKGFGFYSEWDKKPLESLKQRTNMI